MAASDPPHPIKERQMKSPKIKRPENRRGPMHLNLASGLCRCNALMPRYSAAERNVGPRVRPMMYLL
jgi:hypothetical protein